MTPYYKEEWFDHDTNIGLGDVIQLPSMSFGMVLSVMIEETEDSAANLVGTSDEYLVVCLYTGKSNTVSAREKPIKIHKEYVSEVLETAPYHRWIYENYDEFYSKHPYWMDWFVNSAEHFEVTFKTYVDAADRLLALQGASWEPTPPTAEWKAAFWKSVEDYTQSLVTSSTVKLTEINF